MDVKCMESYEVYEIYTDDDGVKKFMLGKYFYDAESGLEDPDKTYRSVEEYFICDLNEIAGRDSPTNWIYGHDDYLNRPCDYIEDLTEKEAEEEFMYCYEHLPHLNLKDLKFDTPDGVYIGLLR